MTHVPTPGTPPRKAGLARRLAGFGAAGFAAALVAAPIAHAAPAVADTSSDSGALPDVAPPTDTPTDTATSPTSPAPTSATPTTGAPTSGTPTSSAPTSGAPTSGAPTSSGTRSSAPGAPVPSSTAPTSASPTPTSAAAQPRGKKAQAAPQADPAPNYGDQKVYVGIQLKSDGSYPAGALLTAANIHYVITAADGTTGSGDCTPVPNGPTRANCSFGPFDGFPLGAGSTAVFTQTSAPTGPGILLDPVSNTVGPCVVGAGPGSDPVSGLPFCGSTGFSRSGIAAPQTVTPGASGATVTFNEPGVPPVAEPDAASVTTGHPADLNVLADDSTGNAPTSDTTLTVASAPRHGTAAVRGHLIRFTPAAGFGGLDSFRYTLHAPNGTSTALVSLTVKAPPIARNATATTVGGRGTEGRAVAVPVLANDSANGGGTLTVAAVGNPPHGTAVIRGADVVYTPAAGFAGVDVFSYTIRTANGTASASIRVTVTAPVVVASAADRLASTGAPSEQLLGVGSLLLLVGGGATVAGRRRRLDT